MYGTVKFNNTEGCDLGSKVQGQTHPKLNSAFSYAHSDLSVFSESFNDIQDLLNFNIIIRNIILN